MAKYKFLKHKVSENVIKKVNILSGIHLMFHALKKVF